MLQRMWKPIVVVGFSREAKETVDYWRLASGEDHGQPGQVGAVLGDWQNSIQSELQKEKNVNCV